jgi:hypothetical protein
MNITREDLKVVRHVAWAALVLWWVLLRFGEPMFRLLGFSVVNVSLPIF